MSGLPGRQKTSPFSISISPTHKEKGLLLYGKGPLVIHHVHEALGDDAWKALLMDLYRDFAGKILTYAQFQSCLSKHDRKGTALAQFNALMTRKGMPGEWTTQ